MNLNAQELADIVQKERDEIHGLDIARDLNADQLCDALIETVAYGDYLAEERKKARKDAYEKKKLYRQQRLVGLSNADGKDAETRKEQADHFAEAEADAYNAADIECDFILDLMKNNHDKCEALRSILSAKKSQHEIDSRSG